MNKYKIFSRYTYNDKMQEIQANSKKEAKSIFLSNLINKKYSIIKIVELY